jgi:hypothetical protein
MQHDGYSNIMIPINSLNIVMADFVWTDGYTSTIYNAFYHNNTLLTITMGDFDIQGDIEDAALALINDISIHKKPTIGCFKFTYINNTVILTSWLKSTLFKKFKNTFEKMYKIKYCV